LKTRSILALILLLGSPALAWGELEQYIPGAAPRWSVVRWMAAAADFTPASEPFADRCATMSGVAPTAPQNPQLSGAYLDTQRPVRFGRWRITLLAISSQTPSETYTFRLWGCQNGDTDLTGCTALDADASTAGVQGVLTTVEATAAIVTAQGTMDQSPIAAGTYDWIGLCAEGDADVTDSGADTLFTFSATLQVYN
jgi:hypothetical protein